MCFCLSNRKQGISKSLEMWDAHEVRLPQEGSRPQTCPYSGFVESRDKIVSVTLVSPKYRYADPGFSRVSICEVPHCEPSFYLNIYMRTQALPKNQYGDPSFSRKSICGPSFYPNIDMQTHALPKNQYADPSFTRK